MTNFHDFVIFFSDAWFMTLAFCHSGMFYHALWWQKWNVTSQTYWKVTCRVNGIALACYFTCSTSNPTVTFSEAVVPFQSCVRKPYNWTVFLCRFDMQLAQAIGEAAFEKSLREKVTQENTSCRWEVGKLRQQLEVRLWKTFLTFH